LSQSINFEHQQKQCCYSYQLRCELPNARGAYYLNVFYHQRSFTPGKVFPSSEHEFGHVSISGLSLLLILALLRGFFSGFPPSTKTNILNSSLTRTEDPHENQVGWCGFLSKYCNLLFNFVIYFVTFPSLH